MLESKRVSSLTLISSRLRLVPRRIGRLIVKGKRLKLVSARTTKPPSKNKLERQMVMSSLPRKKAYLIFVSKMKRELKNTRRNSSNMSVFPNSSLISAFPGVSTWTSKPTSSSWMEYSLTSLKAPMSTLVPSRVWKISTSCQLTSSTSYLTIDTSVRPNSPRVKAMPSGTLPILVELTKSLPLFSRTCRSLSKALVRLGFSICSWTCLKKMRMLILLRLWISSTRNLVKSSGLKKRLNCLLRLYNSWRPWSLWMIRRIRNSNHPSMSVVRWYMWLWLSKRSNSKTTLELVSMPHPSYSSTRMDWMVKR